VWKEVVERGKGKPGADDVKKSNWIKVREVGDRLSVDILSRDIGRGDDLWLQRNTATANVPSTDLRFVSLIFIT